jgi:hypothetical protein
MGLAIFPRFGKSAARFSKAWKSRNGFFRGLERRRAKVSKPWKNSPAGFQSLENRAARPA